MNTLAEQRRARIAELKQSAKELLKMGLANHALLVQNKVIELEQGLKEAGHGND